jgi:3-deoxy-D-manno-octulosonate 8-phosphate phosphatase (KDO 8-P phosphatase)
MKAQPAVELILERASKIKLLALDVDGVLTDGKLYFGNSGEELKSFSTLDGQGIRLLQDNGVVVALITARSSELLDRRARNLDIRHVVQGCENKLTALTGLQEQLKVSMSGTAYVGDDLPDLACITRVGLGVTVPNGHASVRARAFCITTQPGGGGAVREVCDWILQGQGLYEQIISAWS